MKLTDLNIIVENTLKAIDHYSLDAFNLVRGTCAQESHLGYFRKQLGNGPALGIYQIENETFDWLCDVLTKKEDLKNKILKISGVKEFDHSDLQYNDVLSTCFCRLRYLVVPEKLPSNLAGYAYYWKKYYNTEYGAGTEKEFIANYQKYIL